MTRFGLLGVSAISLIGATSTLAQGVMIGLCAAVIMIIHQALMTPLRKTLADTPRLLASLLLLAGLASCLQLGLNAWSLPLALTLGHYPALLSMQSLAVDHLLPTTGRWRHLTVYMVTLLMLCALLGGCRQWLASGPGIHLASLAPGGVMLLGLLLALYNRLRPGAAPSRRQGSL
ncbi:MULTISPECIES: NADH:quinone oxidoreductase [Pseudomonas]|uniref:Electron transport complex protein RnfE n=1 Tax=Pseudomonas putida TaxID=303 RepID=A0A1B2F6M8_PSEPU|nr:MULTISPECIES: NADH:quinone oxidoreductase [Pseudomonas]ANY87912.1 Electron transport complex protein RnfE [Pseudomonas putida]MCL8306989.1 NADH:quinone oxidoreductase [Pseudomonas putida]